MGWPSHKARDRLGVHTTGEQMTFTEDLGPSPFSKPLAWYFKISSSHASELYVPIRPV